MQSLLSVSEIIKVAKLKEALALSDDEIADSSPAGYLKRIERLEALSYGARALLAMERRAYLLSHANGSAFNAI